MAKRAAKGGGSVSKTTRTKPDGTTYTYWTARVDLPRDATGKRRQKTITGHTQKEVLTELKKINAAIQNGTYIEPCKLTLTEWFTQWLDLYKKNQVKVTTYQKYKRDYDVYFKKQLGSIKLADLKGTQIQSVYNAMLERGLTPKSVRNVAAAVTASLDKAVKVGYIAVNPCKLCELPKNVKHEITPLTDAEIPVFLAAINGHRYENVYGFALFSGCREGEFLGLSWKNVDFDAHTVTICQILQKAEKKSNEYNIMPYTKTSVDRTITLPAVAFEYLKAEKKRQAENRLKAGQLWHNEYNLVFTNEIGEHLSIPSVYKEFKTIVKAMGRPDLRVHDLRHSCATLALANGAGLKAVQGLLGHSNASTTLNIYSHVTESMQKDLADRMDNYYSGLNLTKQA